MDSKCSFEDAKRMTLEEYQAKYFMDGMDSIKNSNDLIMDLDEENKLLDDSDHDEDNVSRMDKFLPSCSGSEVNLSSGSRSYVNWRLRPENATVETPMMPSLTPIGKNGINDCQSNRKTDNPNRPYYYNTFKRKKGNLPNNQRKRNDFVNYFQSQRDFNNRHNGSSHTQSQNNYNDRQKGSSYSQTQIHYNNHQTGSSYTPGSIIDLRSKITPKQPIIPTNNCNALVKPNTIAMNERFNLNSPTLLNMLKISTTKEQKTLSTDDLSSFAENLLLKFDKLHEVAQSIKVAEAKKNKYNLSVQKEIATLQKKTLVIKCASQEVVTSDGPGLDDCKPKVDATPVSMNMRFS